MYASDGMSNSNAIRALTSATALEVQQLTAI
jgi:hypothetical protein